MDLHRAAAATAAVAPQPTRGHDLNPNVRTLLSSHADPIAFQSAPPVSLEPDVAAAPAVPAAEPLPQHGQSTTDAFVLAPQLHDSQHAEHDAKSDMQKLTEQTSADESASVLPSQGSAASVTSADSPSPDMVGDEPLAIDALPPAAVTALAGAKKLAKEAFGAKGRKGIAKAVQEMVSAMGPREERRRKLSEETRTEEMAEMFAAALVTAAQTAKMEFADAVAHTSHVHVATEQAGASSTPNMETEPSRKVPDKTADEMMVEFTGHMLRMARDEIKRSGVRDAACIDPLIRLMFSRSCGPMAVEALSWLAIDEMSARVIHSSGGVSRLVRLLHQGGHVSQHAACALGRLAVNSSERQAAVRDAGGVPSLVSLLAAGANSSTANYAAVALCNLMGNNGSSYGQDAAAAILAAPEAIMSLQAGDEAGRSFSMDIDIGSSHTRHAPNSARGFMQRPKSARSCPSARDLPFSSAVSSRTPRSARAAKPSSFNAGLLISSHLKQIQQKEQVDASSSRMDSPSSHISTGMTPRWAKPIGNETPRSSVKRPASCAVASLTPRYMTPRMSYSSRSWSSSPRVATARGTSGASTFRSTTEGVVSARSSNQLASPTSSRPSTFRSSGPGSARTAWAYAERPLASSRVIDPWPTRSSPPNTFRSSTNNSARAALSEAPILQVPMTPKDDTEPATCLVPPCEKDAVPVIARKEFDMTKEERGVHRKQREMKKDKLRKLQRDRPDPRAQALAKAAAERAEEERMAAEQAAELQELLANMLQREGIAADRDVIAEFIDAQFAKSDTIQDTEGGDDDDAFFDKLFVQYYDSLKEIAKGTITKDADPAQSGSPIPPQVDEVRGEEDQVKAQSTRRGQRRPSSQSSTSFRRASL